MWSRRNKKRVTVRMLGGRLLTSVGRDLLKNSHLHRCQPSPVHGQPGFCRSGYVLFSELAERTLKTVSRLQPRLFSSWNMCALAQKDRQEHGDLQCDLSSTKVKG